MECILIVDDSLGSRALAADIVMEEWADCEVLTAPNGRIGLEIALKLIPDIILLDWEMPEMSGIEMLLELRKHASTQETPVIMCTGVHTTSENLEIAFRGGANEFLRKPIHRTELVARIRSIRTQLAYFQAKSKVELENKQLLVAAKEQELRFKRNELASMVIILEQRDRFLQEIQQQLVVLSKECAPGNPTHRELHAVMRRIAQELDSEKNWEAIKVRMNGIHADFLARLTERHPNLTRNELKLCALLKLNLSTKETAQILHISSGGVEKSRYRLRKKLGLEPEEKIENYIHALSGAD